jgi:hypothetical protein
VSQFGDIGGDGLVDPRSPTSGTMARLIVLLLMMLPAGCVTAACDPDDPRWGKDCYECSRKATIEAREAESRGGRAISIRERTEECLRERGYVPRAEH